jgi:FkbM family methyltransferase
MIESVYEVNSQAHFHNLLTLGNRLCYIAWKLSKLPKPFQCRIRNGPTFSMRPVPSADWNTAVEIFLLRVYDLGPDDSVRKVVDLGGNVGYSCLFWCWSYPHATVITFEPHPLHCDLLERHLKQNHYQDRVKLVRAGGAPFSSTATLTDDEVGSSIVRQIGSKPSIQVELVDFFETVGPGPIDILKMDIEGSEYAIMQDDRFGELAARVRHLIMEWHVYEPSHLGSEWCRERLKGLGFQVEMGLSRGRQYGLLKAFRSAKTTTTI